MAHSDKDLIAQKFTGGVNNRFPEAKVSSPFAREMTNLDVTNGAVTTRIGQQKLLARTAPHSLWSSEFLDFGLFVEGDTLMLLGADQRVAPLRAGLQQRDMSYTYIAGKVYWSNGVDTGTVTQGGALGAWGVETPLGSFAAAAAPTGGLDGGTYQVTLTYRAGREESGAPASVFVDVPQDGGIDLTNVPAPRSAAVTAVSVYLSPANDPRLFHTRDLVVGMTSAALGAAQRGAPLRTQFLAPAPAGTSLLARAGRIFMASGKLLRWTESLRYGLHNPEFNYVKMPDPIAGIGAPELPELTLFVGTLKKTYVFRGNDLDAASLVAAAHVGMVPGSLTTVPHELLDEEGVTYDVPLWLGTNGAFYAGTGHGVLQLNKFAAARVYDKAAVSLSERGYMTVAGRGGKSSGLAIKDRMVARVVEIG